MNFLQNFLKKFKNKNRNNKILFQGKITKKFRSKRKKKFDLFKKNFTFRNISISDFYNKNNNIYIYYFFIGGILIFLTIYAFFFSGYFNVKKILIFEKNIEKTNLINMDLAYKSINNYQYKSIFFIDKQKIKKSLKTYQNSIEKIDIKRLFPSSLKIVLTSQKPIFRTKIENKQYVILKNGVFVPTTKFNNLSFIKIYQKGLGKEKIIDYKKIFSSKEINYLQYLFYNFKINFILNKIKEFRFFPIEREAHIVLDNNVILIFSLGKNLKQQIEKIVIFSKEQKKVFGNSFYIDLRIFKKVFYCSKKDSFQCKKNLKNIYHLENKDFIFEQAKKENKKNPKK